MKHEEYRRYLSCKTGEQSFFPRLFGFNWREAAEKERMEEKKEFLCGVVEGMSRLFPCQVM